MGKKACFPALTILILLGAGQLSAQVRLGGQVEYAEESKFGFGPRVVIDDPALGALRFIGTFDFFFPKDQGGIDSDYWEVNANAAYDFGIKSQPTVTPYLGGGLNISHSSVEGIFASGSDTELGINLLGGLEFSAGRVHPFVEIKVELEGGEQFVATGGILF